MKAMKEYECNPVVSEVGMTLYKGDRTGLCVRQGRVIEAAVKQWNNTGRRQNTCTLCGNCPSGY